MTTKCNKQDQSQPLINVPNIRNNIKRIHKRFIDAYGASADKVIADKRLQLYTVWNRILLIAKCFAEENIISGFKDVSSETNYFTLRLDKDQVDRHIYILTDGEIIVMKDSGFYVDGKLRNPDVEVLYNVCEQNYDWESFADKLLNYIHETIYARQKALEVSVFGDDGGK